MMGLILKDFYNMKSIIKFYMLFPLFAAVLSYANHSISMMIFLPAFLSMFFMMSAFAYDEMSSFDEYALTLPLLRRDLVNSKYVLTIMIMAAMQLLSLLISVALLTIFPDQFMEVNVMETIMSILASSAAVLLLLSIQLPFIFYLGNEKARVILMIGFIVVGVGGGYVVNMFKEQLADILLWNEQTIFICIASLAFIAVITFLISNKVSIGIMNRKEL